MNFLYQVSIINLRKKMKNILLSIQGMTCSHCTNFIKMTVEELPGIQSVEVTLKDGTAEVKYDETKVSDQEIANAVADTHFILLATTEI